MKSCLIITSCIYPFASFVKLINPREREQLHISALKRWIVESSFETIIICDNSNYVYCDELILLAANHGKILEVLFFEGDKDKSKRLGKGYGEGEIIEYVFNNSNYINEFNSFFKVTGKLFVENCNEYMNFQDVDFAFDFSYSFYWNKDKVDCVFTNFYYANLISFKLFLKDQYLNVRDNEGFFLEHAYASALQKTLNVKILPIVPSISGISGSSGTRYSYTRKLIAVVKKTLLLSTFIRKL
jgi:hypothetical protein